MRIPVLRWLPALLLLSLAGLAGETTFALAVIPDAQQEVLRPDDTRLANRMQWLVGNREKLNLKLVMQVGDLHNWDTPDHIQYERSSAAFAILDQAKLPYVLTLGNHDTAATKQGGSAAPGNVHDNLRTTTTFNTYFPTTRFQALQGVFEEGKMDNAWHTFQAGGLDWLVLDLELWARKEAVAWAKTVVEAHPNHNIIVLTHSHLAGSNKIDQRNGGYGDNSPQYVYDQLLKPYPNIRLVFSGHAGKHAYRLDHGDKGNAIYQFSQCYHSNETNPVRLFEIDTQSGRLKTWVYCPSKDTTLDDGSTMEITDIDWVKPAPEPR